MDFWVVVSIYFFFHPYLGKIPILTKGSKPPTRFMLIVFCWFLFKGSRSNRQIVIKKKRMANREQRHFFSKCFENRKLYNSITKNNLVNSLTKSGSF